MFYGEIKIKDFRELLTVLGTLAFSVSALMLMVYVWSFNQGELDLNTLDVVEATVLEKKEYSSRYGKQYRFVAMTKEGKKTYTLNKSSSNTCCFTHLVPYDEQVTILADWSWLNGLTVYQIYHKDQLVFNAVPTAPESSYRNEKILFFSVYAFISGFLFLGIRQLYDRIQNT